MSNQHSGVQIEEPKFIWGLEIEQAIEVIAGCEPEQWIEVIEYMRNTLRGRASMACQDFDKMSKNWAEVAEKI